MPLAPPNTQGGGPLRKFAWIARALGYAAAAGAGGYIAQHVLWPQEQVPPAMAHFYWGLVLIGGFVVGVRITKGSV